MWKEIATFGVVLATAPGALGASVEEHLRDPAILLKANCPSGDSIELPKKFFFVCYHQEWRIARWVAYFLTPADLKDNAERKDNFHIDDEIKIVAARSTPRDYKGTGYHKGHQAPAEDFTRSVAAMSATFVMSNMAPQTAQLNSGKWRVLEDQVRKVAAESRGVWVFTGSLFAKEAPMRRGRPRNFTVIDPPPTDNKKAWLGGGRVAVPTHSFKAILVVGAENSFKGYGFVLPNQRKALALSLPDYGVSIDIVERLTGLDFFAALDDAIEGKIEEADGEWPPKREAKK